LGVRPRAILDANMYEHSWHFSFGSPIFDTTSALFVELHAAGTLLTVFLFTDSETVNAFAT
jgi:hypothetical protein